MADYGLFTVPSYLSLRSSPRVREWTYTSSLQASYLGTISLVLPMDLESATPTHAPRFVYVGPPEVPRVSVLNITAFTWTATCQEGSIR